MSNASKAIGKPEAIDLIYDEIVKIYDENNKEKKFHKKAQTNTEVKDNEIENNEEHTKVLGIKKK